MDVKDVTLGWTPLRCACSEGNREVRNLLLANEAEFYLRDNLMGRTPVQVLELAIYWWRLESSETWVDEKENAAEGNNEEWQDKVNESEEQHETQSLNQSHEMYSRGEERSCVYVSHFKESIRETTRSARQADINHENDLASASTFPEHRYLEEASDATLRTWSSRNLQRVYFVKCNGEVRGRGPLSPAAHYSLNLPCRVWAMDLQGNIRSLTGL